MPDPKKKSGLALLIGMKPQSRNGEGVTGPSMTEPDQGGMEEETIVEEEVVEKPEREEPSIALPPGFRPPDGVEEDQDFDTTCRACVRGDRLYFKKVGDMPVTPEGQEEELEEEDETMVDEMAESEDQQAAEAAAGTEMHPEAARVATMKKRRAEEQKARNVFRGGY